MRLNKLLLNLSYICLLVCILSLSAAAQDALPPDGVKPPMDKPNAPPPNPFKELDLTPDQVKEFRRINAGRRPIEIQARDRFQEAKKNLDITIYKDVLNEADFQARLAEFQNAQSELARIKFSSELEVRKILTPEQLVKFRELRQRFEQQRDQMQNKLPRNRPLQQLRRLKRQNRQPLK